MIEPHEKLSTKSVLRQPCALAKPRRRDMKERLLGWKAHRTRAGRLPPVPRVGASANVKTQTVYMVMTMSSTAHTARMIAKLLANRATARDEIPDLIVQVHRTLSNIDRPRGRSKAVKEEAEIKTKTAAPSKLRCRQPREEGPPGAV